MPTPADTANRWRLMMIFLALAVAGPACAAESVPRLTVRGEALLAVPADHLEMAVGVITEDPAADVALKENNLRMQRVITAVRKLGLAGNEYHTGRFQVMPQWSPAPRNPPPEWRPEITGYTVTNMLAIRTPRLELVGRIIATANEAGANSVDTIRFTLQDPRASRDAVITAATRNAVADAESLAAAAMVRLVRVLDLKLDHAAVEPVRMSAERGMTMLRLQQDAPEPPLSADDVTVQATVLISYEIE